MKQKYTIEDAGEKRGVHGKDSFSGFGLDKETSVDNNGMMTGTPQNSDTKTASSDLSGHRSEVGGGQRSSDCGRRRKVKEKVARGVQSGCCNDKWVTFTEDTSLHGLKYIWMRNIYLCRRLLWLSMTLACSAIMMYQILDRVIYYINMPVTVDVRINFNTSLDFPAVTFCNQNAFRASRAAELGIYDLLTDIYDDVRPFQTSELRQYGADNMSMEQIYKDTRHMLDDLLISCNWLGAKCGKENFQMTVTDHGVCYTLDNKNLSVNSAGAEDGLSLLLNVEQYEYMPGPHDAAGVKILLHDKKEFPKVHALGQALSAGVHSFLAIKLVSVRNLPSPHGECDSPPLWHHDHYSTANCEVECTTTTLNELCGCKLFFMPGDFPVCTLWQYYGCYIPKKTLLRRRVSEECYCPIPCDFKAYDPVVSYATASPLSVERFLAGANKTALALRYHRARDITHRLQREKRELFQGHLEDLGRRLNTLRNTSMVVVSLQLAKQRQGLNKVVSDMFKVYNQTVYLFEYQQYITGKFCVLADDAMSEVASDVFKVYNQTVYLFEYQQYITEKDFVRAADAMSERTFSVVAAAMQEFVYTVQNKIRQLGDPSVVDPAVRQTLYLLTRGEIGGKIDIAERALENYTQLYDAVIRGTPIFNYKFRTEWRNMSKYIVPLPLFREAMDRSQTIKTRSKRVHSDLEDVISGLEMYERVTEEAFTKGTVNETAMGDANVQFLRSCREYLQSIDMFINDFLKHTVSVMELRLSKFHSDWRDFAANRDSLSLQLDSIAALAKGLEEGIFLKVEEGLNKSKTFLADGSVSKQDVARVFVSSEVQLGQGDLKNFFAELRSRGQEVYDLWCRLEKDSGKIYNTSLTDPNLKRYYRVQNVWDYLGSVLEALKLMQGEYDQYKAADIRDAIKNYDDEFLTSLDAMVAEMQEFLESGRIDTAFIRSNFLRLNIFYRELNYEQITQQEAYDIFALLCDIGGSMGLFLGASVLTIFEFLDLAIFQYGNRK